MKALSLAIAVLGCLLLAAGELLAVDSQAIRITPENVDQQETLQIAVECEGRLAGSVPFVVRVRAAEGAELPDLEALLSVQLYGRPAAICPVSIERAQDEIRCEFRVTAHYLESSLLYFVDRSNSEDQNPQTYWLHLKDFGAQADPVPTITGRQYYEPALLPPGLSENAWVTSDDGVLSLRLSTTAPVVPRSYPMYVVVELRNNSDQATTVLRPGGDDQTMLFSWIQIFAPDGQRVDCAALIGDYSYGPDAFTTLEAGETITCCITLTVDNYPYSDVAGDYEVRFHYAPDESYRTRAAEEFGFPNVWIGEINSQPVTVEKE